MTAAGRTTTAPCPECGKPSVASHRPFCSARCKAVDLNRWLSNGYAIPGPPAGPEDLPDNDN